MLERGLFFMTTLFQDGRKLTLDYPWVALSFYDTISSRSGNRAAYRLLKNEELTQVILEFW